jgi:hypothetical protein
MSDPEISQDAPEQPVVNPTNGAKKPREQRESIRRYPASVTVSITMAMAESLVRMCPVNGPLSQSVYLRLLLHQGLMADDAAYRQAMGGNNA